MRSDKYALYRPNLPDPKNYDKIGSQIQCVMREINRRERSYQYQIAHGKMTLGQAEYEINCMKAVYKTLTEVERCHFDKHFNRK